MSVEYLVGLLIVGVVMFVGLAGTLLPGIPGAPLILIAAIAHRLYFGSESTDTWVLVVLLVLTILSILLDFLASMLGAKKLGATWRGVVGAVLGAIIGIFFNLPGIILGPFIGAFLFEFAGGREWRASLKAGAGAMLGIVLGTAGRIACCVVMIALFYFNVLIKTVSPVTPEKDPVIAHIDYRQ